MLRYVIGRDLVQGSVKSMLVTQLIGDHFARAARYAVDNSQTAKTYRHKISVPPYLEHHFKSHVYDWYNEWTITSVDKFSNSSNQMVITLTPRSVQTKP